ncbi:phage baseplate upper protein [Enterococcus casseliflavus]|uniref:phage baseplate upper protein n=1 Tax=Enterococcus casseliflavus TaxID=37734 RepID=UPI0039A6677B
MVVKYPVTLSITESNNVGLIKVRQADEESQVLDVTVTENGVIKTFDGLTPFFCLMAREITGQGVSEEPVTVYDGTKGTLKYTLSANAMQMVGRNEAYFSFRKELTNGAWAEQFSTKSFYYTVEKSIYTQPFKDSNYWFTFKELYRLFNDYIDSGKLTWEDFMDTESNNWKEFLEQNKEILESIDPGGTILKELIGSRTTEDGTTYPSLPERLDGQIGLNSDFRSFESDESVLRRIKNEIFEQNGANIKWLAGGETDADITDIVQNAVNDYSSIYFPPGEWTINGMISIGANKRIRLASGATVVKREDSLNQPIFWFKDNGSSITGENLETSRIRSMASSPLGVVLFGNNGVDDTEARRSNYNTLSNVQICGAGPIQGTEKNVAIQLYAPQINDGTTYFNLIKNLRVMDANCGILFEGWANANILNNIHFFRCGNEKYFDLGAISLRSIDSKGPIENIVTNVFHHQSTNADTLKFAAKSCNYNNFISILSEQGGTSARWLSCSTDASGAGNVVSGSANTAGGGINLPDSFGISNVVYTLGRVQANEVTAKSASIKDLSVSGTSNFGDYVKKTQTFNSSLKENAQYQILKITLPVESTVANTPVRIQASGSVKSSNGFSFAGNAELDCIITQKSNALTIKDVSVVGNVNLWARPAINGREIILIINLETNGTTTAGYVVQSEVKVSGVQAGGVTFEKVLVETSGSQVFFAGRIQTAAIGTTAQRPKTDLIVGQMFFDTTIGKPVWYSAGKWIDAAGSAV